MNPLLKKESNWFILGLVTQPSLRDNGRVGNSLDCMFTETAVGERQFPKVKPEAFAQRVGKGWWPFNTPRCCPNANQ